MKLPPLPPILIDSNETQIRRLRNGDVARCLAYTFEGYATRKANLQTGDYSLLGYEGEVAVERKSKEDAWGCVGGSRLRFTECLRRLREIESPSIVIEVSLDDFAKTPPYTRLSPAQAVNAFISWSQEYRIPVFFCPSRAHAERVTLRWLQAFWRHHNRTVSG